ncbi:DUF302 domain-containing protein [Bacteroidota bacterium]
MKWLKNIFFLSISIIIITSCQKTDDNNYFFSKQVAGNIDTISNKLELELKNEGFGIVSHINMQEKLQEKLDVNIGEYHIFGVCNPLIAYNVLQKEKNIGLLLPCNIIIREIESGLYLVAAINPEVTLQAFKNKELKGTGKEVKEKLIKVIESI